MATPLLERFRRIDWATWRPRLGYAAFALVAFLVALRFTFPADAVRERMVLEAAARGLTLEVQRIHPGGGLLGLAAEGITLDDGSGVKLAVDEATVTLRFWPLLAGRRSIAFDAALWDGRVRGQADLSGDPRPLEVTVDGVDLARAMPLRRASGLDLVGKVSGHAELELPATPQGKLRGTAEAHVDGAGVAGGAVPVPGMTGGLPVPKLALGALSAQTKVDQGKATFQKLEARGGDAEITGEDVYVVVFPSIGVSPLSGRIRLRIHDAFWTQSGMQGFKGIAEAAMAGGRTSDGSYLFQVSGSLAHPSARPAGPGAPAPASPQPAPAPAAPSHED